MKSIWKGSISFGLVTIPVKLYSAVQEHVLGFKMLCQTCSTPITNKRWCNHCKKEVTWDHVVKGLEVTKGEYIVLTQEMIKKLKPETSNIIDIVEFVDTELIAPIYYDQYYYVAPESGQKSYALLCQALQVMGKAAIGKFVMRDKEHACALQSYENGILLSTLNYAYEIRSMSNIGELAVKQPKVEAAELKLAKLLVEQLSKKKFDISEFKDAFAQELQALLKKHKTGKMVKLKETKVKHNKKAVSLVSALKESLEHARA